MNNRWKELERDFRQVPDWHNELRVERQQYRDGMPPGAWILSGSLPERYRSQFEEVARSAGKELITDPAVRPKLPNEVIQEPDDLSRWFAAIQFLTDAYRKPRLKYESDDGQTRFAINCGRIDRPLQASISLCLYLAAQAKLIALAPEANEAPVTRGFTGRWKMPAESDLIKRIVHLLQEIIIHGAETICKAQQGLAAPNFMARSYSGPILTFELDSDKLSAHRVEFDFAKQIAVAQAPKVRKMAESWPSERFTEIEEALGQFYYWQQRLSADIEDNLYIIQKHLQQSALIVLCRVRDYAHIFWQSIYGEVADLFRESTATGELIFRGRSQKPGGVASCVDEYNLVMQRLKREVERKRLVPASTSSSRDSTVSDRDTTMKGLPGLEEKVLSSKIAVAPTRADIVRKFIASATDFRDRERVKALCEALDAAKIRVSTRKARIFSGKAGPRGFQPTTWMEIYGKPSSAEYKRLFISRNSPLLKDLYESQK